MQLPNGIIGPTVGAFISGIIGLIAVEYRNYRQRAAEIERWYYRAGRLAEQVKRETPETYLSSFHSDSVPDEAPERADDMIAAYGRIGNQLRDHINQAPPGVSEAVIDSATETAQWCQITDREGRTQGFLERARSAVESANQLKADAEKSKENFGWF